MLGMTNCGKTTFTRRLVSELRRLYPLANTYVCDSKGAGDFDMWGGHTDSERAPALPRGDGRMQVWTPPSDNLDEYDRWFHAILKRREPAIVIIDELSSIGGRRGVDYPVGYAKLLKQGRGLHISLITLSQEYAGMPRQVAGQTTHLVRFRLLNRFDRKAADALLGRPFEEDESEPREEHGFFYSRLDRQPRRYIEYAGHQQFF